MDREISRRVFLERAAALGGIVATWRVDAQARGLPSGPAGPGLGSATLLTLAAMAAQIIPADETPGAGDAGIVDYLKARIESSGTLRDQCEDGARTLNALSERTCGTPFAMLDAATARTMLGDIDTSEFFRTVRDLTVKGFYSSPWGWRSIGFPGHGQPHGHGDFDQRPAGSVPAPRLTRVTPEFIVVRSDIPAEDW